MNGTLIQLGGTLSKVLRETVSPTVTSSLNPSDGSVPLGGGVTIPGQVSALQLSGGSYFRLSNGGKLVLS